MGVYIGAPIAASLGFTRVGVPPDCISYTHLVWPLQNIVLLRGLCAESIIRLLPPPPALRTLLHYYRTSIAQYTTSPPTPLLYVIHHTIVLTAISCKGQLSLYTILPSLICYGVWHTKGGSVGGAYIARWSSNGIAIG